MEVGWIGRAKGWMGIATVEVDRPSKQTGIQTTSVVLEVVTFAYSGHD